MELIRITNRVWYYPFEKERDRPILGYVKGDDWSLAIDAGHSRLHTLEFYSALEKEGLPMPTITILTHWHWDHSFGMHAIKGKCLSNERTKEHLVEFKNWYEENDVENFLELDECIRKEYSDLKNNPVVITVPDNTFINELRLDAGNVPFDCCKPNLHTQMILHLLLSKMKRYCFLVTQPVEFFRHGRRILFYAESLQI